MTNLIEQSQQEQMDEMFNQLYNGSCYTIVGAGGDIKQWIDGYTKMLEEEGIGTPTKFYTYTGAQMNSKYGLFGPTAYPSDLTFLSFSLENLNISKLAIFKIRMGDRWFDDIVDNNFRHMS